MEGLLLKGIFKQKQKIKVAIFGRPQKVFAELTFIFAKWALYKVIYTSHPAMSYQGILLSGG